MTYALRRFLLRDGQEIAHPGRFAIACQLRLIIEIITLVLAYPIYVRNMVKNRAIMANR